MLVNADKVYRCVCPQKNERQQRKPVIDGIRNKKKNKKFRIKSEEKKSVVSRIEWYN